MAIDASPTKTAAAGVMVYLMEELTDARLRCEQLKRYIQDAVKLIENSPHRDHFFEVAGHLMHGIPESLFKLDKALSATALAATKLDYDELKQALKPEKVEELERVLEDSRIRYVTRRSGDPQMTPKDTAQAIRAMATVLEKTGRFPVKMATELVAILREEQPNIRLASMPCVLPPVVLTTMADAIENGTLRNRERLSAMIDTAITQALGGQQMQALLQTANSREEVMDGFKKENPALTDEQLNEIADQWEANKDVVKDKTAGAGEEFQKANPAITDEQAKIIDEMHAKHKDVIKDKHNGKTAATLEDAAKALTELRFSFHKAEAMLEDDTAHAWKTWKLAAPSNTGVNNEVKQLVAASLDIQSSIRKQMKIIDSIKAQAGFRTAAESNNVSKFTEGEPADPTKNMTEEQKAEWKRQNEEHKDEFKA